MPLAAATACCVSREARAVGSICSQGEQGKGGRQGGRGNDCSGSESRLHRSQWAYALACSIQSMWGCTAKGALHGGAPGRERQAARASAAGAGGSTHGCGGPTRCRHCLLGRGAPHGPDVGADGYTAGQARGQPAGQQGWASTQAGTRCSCLPQSLNSLHSPPALQRSSQCC